MRFLVLCVAALFLVACDENLGTPTTPEAAAEKMSALVARSPTFNRIPQQCTLAIYQSKPATAGGSADCDQDPAACLAQCEAGNAAACFNAARTIEKGRIADDSDRIYPLFMASCALGNGNACVNAAATVKNGQWTGSLPATTQGAQCQFQTYDRMCKDGHPWGCYMVGGEYRRSDGFRPRNQSLAEASFRRACSLDSNSGACLENYK